MSFQNGMQNALLPGTEKRGVSRSRRIQNRKGVCARERASRHPPAQERTVSEESIRKDTLGKIGEGV